MHFCDDVNVLNVKGTAGLTDSEVVNWLKPLVCEL